MLCNPRLRRTVAIDCTKTVMCAVYAPHFVRAGVIDEVYKAAGLRPRTGPAGVAPEEVALSEETKRNGFAKL
jgi:hypothetical protein